MKKTRVATSMASWCRNIMITLVLCEILVSGAHVYAETEEWTPVSVWTSAEPVPEHSVDLLIDGNAMTWATLPDDSRTGSAAHVSERNVWFQENVPIFPVNGSTPVTATVVFDLGESRTVCGLRFQAPPSLSSRGPAQITVFSCSDARGERDRNVLLCGHKFPPIATSHCEFAQWPPMTTRYIGIQIDDSWERSDSEGHGGDYFSDDILSSPYRFKATPNFGWWHGIWRRLLKEQGLEYSGYGDRFLCEMAEVSFFAKLPNDFKCKNEAQVAYPPDRLLGDWLMQDAGQERLNCFSSDENAIRESNIVDKVLNELKECGIAVDSLQKERTQIASQPGSDPRWLDLYTRLCKIRRELRIQRILDFAKEFVYVKHYVFGGWTEKSSTENLTDGEFDFRPLEWHPGSQLCLVTINNDGTIKHEVLLEKPNGIIRDPAFSPDGKQLYFSMREDVFTDNFKLYEMDFPSRNIRKITTEPVINGKPIPCADFEPVLTPDNRLVFSSTRCGSVDDCWIQATANLYSCNTDGSDLRRLGFDQVHTYYPQMLSDGRLIYTRWEYNDRAPFNIQSLFTMNPDGTSQTEYYGNDCWFPTTLLHARAVPGTSKVVAIASGHHTMQKGKLVLVDRSSVTQGDAGIEFIAGSSPKGLPGRQPSNELPGDHWDPNRRFYYDFFGQIGPQFMHPYAFDEKNYLCSFLPEGSIQMKGPFYPPFGVYYMTDEGKRELLAFDWTNSCDQPVPRPIQESVTAAKSSQVDLASSFGRFYVQNVYEGEGMKGVAPGSVQSIRVVGLEYRSGRAGKNSSVGIAGNSPVPTPISVGGGAWDVKHVLGEVSVEEDGSALFEVPANTPLYFQLLDAQRRTIQTMRSWSTLMPGEVFSCIGCHEDKINTTNNTLSGQTIALSKPVQRLQPSNGYVHPFVSELYTKGRMADIDTFMGINRVRSLDQAESGDGFSYPRFIQPIWDRHCISCHAAASADKGNSTESKFYLTGNPATSNKRSRRSFTESYLQLTKEGLRISCDQEVKAFEQKHGKLPLVCWVHSMGPASMEPPYATGANRSRLMQYLEPEHYEVQLTEDEKGMIACWIDLGIPFCGSYGEANLWSKKQAERINYLQNKRRIFAEEEWKALSESMKSENGNHN